jgi:hypothetical protein
MGQYYYPTSIDKMEYLYSHDFDNGLKLMEHSYVGNHFVRAVEKLLSPKGAWHKTRFCWAGDYMDAGLFLPEGTPLKCEEGYDITLHSVVREEGKNAFERLVEIEKYDFSEWEKKKKLVEELTKKWLKTLPRKGRYLVNHTKKLCLDLKAEDVDRGKDKHGDSIWNIHPLPLLTCSGNGRGGGDYSGSKMNIVGTWAGDVISLEHKPMYTLNKPILFSEKYYGGDVSEEYHFISEEQIQEKEKTEKEEEAFKKSEEAELLG